MFHAPYKVYVVDIGFELFKIEIGAEAGMGGDAGENDFDEHKNHYMVHHDRKSILSQIFYSPVFAGNRSQQTGNAEPEGNT